jgi:hypothetical protein
LESFGSFVKPRRALFIKERVTLFIKRRVALYSVSSFALLAHRRHAFSQRCGEPHFARRRFTSDSPAERGAHAAPVCDPLAYYEASPFYDA